MGKIRYLRQRTNFDCGPTVIVNSIKWSGGRATWRDLKPLYGPCGITSTHEGSKSTNIAALLREQDTICLSKKKSYPSLETVEEWIDRGHAVLIFYFLDEEPDERTREEPGHVALCIGKDSQGYFKIINYSSEETISMVSRKQLEQDLQRIPAEDSPVAGAESLALFIRKK